MDGKSYTLHGGNEGYRVPYEVFGRLLQAKRPHRERNYVAPRNNGNTATFHAQQQRTHSANQQNAWFRPQSQRQQHMQPQAHRRTTQPQQAAPQNNQQQQQQRHSQPQQQQPQQGTVPYKRPRLATAQPTTKAPLPQPQPQRPPSSAALLRAMQEEFDKAQAFEEAVAALLKEKLNGSYDMLKRECARLTQTVASAHPFHEGFFYCTERLKCTRPDDTYCCLFASKSETEALKHMRQAHPQSGGHPKYISFQNYSGGMAIVGQSCAVAAAVALVCTLPDSQQHLSPAIKRAFASSEETDARALTDALGLALPVAPATAMVSLAAIDRYLGTALRLNQTVTEFCTQCGASVDTAVEPEVATLNVFQQDGTPTAITAETLDAMLGYDMNLPDRCSCGGSLAKHQEAYPTQLLAITLVPPDGATGPVGVVDLPATLCVPTQEGHRTFQLHGTVTVKGEAHVVAYVREPTRTEDGDTWHCYNGRRHAVSTRPPNPLHTDTLLYRRVPEQSAIAHAEECDNEDGATNEPAPPTQPQVPPPPPLPRRDHQGRILYGSQPHPDMAVLADNEEDEHDSSAPPLPQPPARRPRPEEGTDEDAQTHAEPPATADQAASLTVIAANQQDARFRHQLSHDTNSDGQCPVHGCGYTSRTIRRNRRGELLQSHLNTVHSAEERASVADACMAASGFVLCTVCGQAVKCTVRGRGAHACGEYNTRASQIREQRARYVQVIGSQDATRIADQTRQAEADQRANPANAEDGTEATVRDDWILTKPRTIRTLHRSQWNNWAAVCRGTLLGYTADNEQGKYRRQECLTNLVRDNLQSVNTATRLTGEPADGAPAPRQRPPHTSDGEDEDPVRAGLENNSF